jgi:hypothetical protein
MEGKHMNKRLIRLLSLLFAFSLVAAACGDSDGGNDSTTTDEESTEAAPADEEQSEEGGTIDDDEAAAAFDDDDDDDDATTEAVDESPAETIEDLQADWATSRQAVIDMLTEGIEAGDFGIGDDNILRGPSGFQIDLNDCPGDWSNTGGITDTEIRLGQSFVRSGTLAAYINLSIGMEMWYKYTTQTGGVDGKDLVFITKDDGYVAAQTIEVVDELIQAENVFFLQTLSLHTTTSTTNAFHNPW